MKQLEWMEKYTKKEIINGLKNIAYPNRASGGKITSFEEISVIRQGYMTDNNYNYTHQQPLSKIKEGTNMTNYQLIIDNIQYSWKDLSKLSIGLLRYKAFRAELTEENMDEIKC